MKASSTSERNQNSSALDTGLECFLLIARLHQKIVSPEQLTHELGIKNNKISSEQILFAAKSIGLKAKLSNASAKKIGNVPLPVIAEGHDGCYFIIARHENNKILIQNPAKNNPEIINELQLVEIWNGSIILFKDVPSIGQAQSKFDFTWFIPAIVKYRKLLREVVVASFFLQLFSLATPLFFQVVMDKVLIHHGLTTLNVIAIGLLIIMFFESGLSILRTYIFAHTTSRIDVELGAKLFRHMITLPLPYFQSRRVGDSVARVKELENVRNFLTSNSITLIMDVFFSTIFIAVMFFYSGWLALVVVASLPLYVILSVIITPFLRSKLSETSLRSAENQAFLVETINGIDTIKAMTVEPQTIRKWENQLAGYVSVGLKAQTLSSLANESVALIGKLVTVATLWEGAHLVVDGQLTVGQLIAFNMLAGRVSQPIIRIAQLWTNFQQTGISVQRLGEILNTPNEAPRLSRTVMPLIKGNIEFDRVTFRYRVDGPEILRSISVSIKPGDFIGIVGKSGSGKSTLTKLLQRTFIPEQGRVLVDGVDIALADPASLRRQIGVVLQDSMLFNRTIRENIALGDPGTPMEMIVRAATLSGAHDFILEMPEGYDTMVGEHGASLSGGQRQRIAIARALINNPRILIFDEATSALDYESERLIQQNMVAISRGRTVIVIAHRLSAVRDANRIIVLDRGEIVEQGTHSELLASHTSHYSKLHRIQGGGRG